MGVSLSDNFVQNSVTNSLSDEKLDNIKAFTFIEYLNYSSILTDDTDNFKSYEIYLQSWQSFNNNENINFDSQVKEQYIEFLKDITLNFTTNEERRYLSNIDFNNEENVSVALPFFTKKIKDIIIYYKNKRDTYQQDLRISKNKGSVRNIKEFIKNEIVNLFIGDEASTEIISGLSASELQSKVSVEVEESYDTFNDYYDINPTKKPDFVELTEEREKYYTSNTNYISGNEFVNIDNSIINIINNKKITLNEIAEILIQVNTADDNLLDKFDYQDYKITDRDNLKFLLHAELAKNLIGTDYYYLSTDTQGNYLSGVLFEANSKVESLLNTNFPTSLTVPNYVENNERNVGLFFKPTNFSVLKMEGKFDSFLKEDLLPNNLYIFPDIKNYGNIVGMSETVPQNPFGFKMTDESYRGMDSSYGQKIPKKFSKNQGFYSYDTLQQKRTDFKNLSSFQSNIRVPSNFGILDKHVSDIYGNQYFIFYNDSFYIENIDKSIEVYDKNIFTGSNTLTTFTESFSSREKQFNIDKQLKDVYVLNVSTNVFAPLSSQFDNLYKKYETLSHRQKPGVNETIYEELTGKILDFNVYKNVFTIKTQNYTLIDVYDYSGSFTTLSIPVLLNNKDIDQIKYNQLEPISEVSNDFIYKDKLYKALVSLTPSSSANNNTFYYEFLEYNLNSYQSNYITNRNQNTKEFFDNNFSLNLDVKVKSIKSVQLTYNEKQNLFNLLVQYNDSNENVYLHNLSYYIFNNEIIFINNDIHKSDKYSTTFNFFSGGTGNEVTYSPLSTQPTINTLEGVLIL